MYQLNCFKFTGDGDSSVLKRLRIAKPYGSDIMIKKMYQSYIKKLH